MRGRELALAIVVVLGGCGPSLWSAGGGSRSAAPSFGGGGDGGGDGGDVYGGLELDDVYAAGGDGGGGDGDGGDEVTGPIADRAGQLADAADLLRKAQRALDGGNQSLAELLFSSAELLTGAEAVADLAPQFRTGAPPRVTTAPVALPDAGPQDVAVGDSDAEDAAEPPPPPEPDEPPVPELGSLDGTLAIDGAAPGGTMAFVTLEPLDRKGRVRKKKERIMEQRNREFAPRLMLVPVGSTVSFPNYDKIFHNVFSASAVASFDLGLYREGQARSMTFEKEGFVKIGCNLHANMAATVVVIGAPHYVFTKDSGAFRFAKLVPGRYKLRAWSEKTKEPITQTVTIKAGANKVSVGVGADGASGPLPDKFGKARGKK
jgi:plastocyanin